MPEEKKWKHIGDSMAFNKQQFYWMDIPKQIEIEFELINFYKSPVQESRFGARHDFAAYCTKNIPEMGLIEGDIIQVGFSYRTLARAMQVVPLSLKRSISRDMGNDNIFIRFIKKNDMCMQVLDLERRQENPELSKTADELVYGAERDYPERRKQFR